MFADRLARARAVMTRADVDALLVSVGADLPYLTGYEAILRAVETLVAGEAGA